ncbi:ABC transporter substrate-binding protein [Granulosicoccus antarcticus]|uniref:Uncharacterized protein n=1 Tax=Granulosicoccus antarcticus IMCC3135 TaxID=1192854 RepID=A0A2Z2NXU7_9GAMM|nr:ABC transporter substrate-binding protein [Granulosicoccus antarcticus]ASJ76286.1 hypothetical protein IMCC3135_31190 [Granulosicoccus antarcticus IMCC3135]
MSAQFTGLTWDHPRGYDALAQSAERVNHGLTTPLIHWNKQPLEGFESAPIAELAAANDLLVLDHPHLGEAVASGCLIPLDELYSVEQIQSWSSHCVGNSLNSYQMDGKTWALPLDVATQVIARRADRISEAPQNWASIEALSRDLPVALSLAGPHAILNVMSIAAASGALPGGVHFLPDDALRQGLELMQRLYDRRPAGSETLNPIALLDSMSHCDDIALVPLIFGYVTYSIPDRYPHHVAFSDSVLMPSAETKAGSNSRFHGVLGGTGIGFSTRSIPSAALLSHIADLLSPACQQELFPEFGGQPSLRSAWQNENVNRSMGNFYLDCLASAEAPLLRPRFDGYIAFQSAAAQTVRDCLAGIHTIDDSIKGIRQLWTQARSEARGNLDDRYIIREN